MEIINLDYTFNTRDLSDRLDSIESQQETMLNKIDQLNKANQLNGQINNTQLSKKEELVIFIKKAKKEYLWFGSNAEFSRSKRLITLSCIGVFIIGIISTILTSKTLGIYSTYTFFENIIIFEACFIIYHANSAKKIN